LTADDLKELGVAAIGHRRKLLTAIAALREAPAPSAPVSETSIPPRPADSAAERRLLTILFCDLVGSTEIATRLDPEDLREVIAVYQRCVAEVLKRFGGFVAKYMGDGILAYFGYPQAHEEDAEQAVRAALAIVAAVGRLDVRTPLAVRLGIATGQVVVGDLLGEGVAQEQSVVGETPNLAARLQGLAGADQIIIADATRQHVGTLFELRNFGKQELKGFAGVTQAWQVVGESGVASRFEALRSRAAPLVGREEELELLLRRWAQSKAGDGRVVLLSAEPGIGKSRLTEAVHERIGVDPHRRLRYFCSPHHQDGVLYPVIGQLERAACFSRDDDDATRRNKLAAMMTASEMPATDLPLLADLLSLPGAEAELPPNLTPQQRKERTFDLLIGGLAIRAREVPVLMVFEDAHWMDPTTLELLDRLIRRVETLPVLVVVTFRPEFQASWVGQAHVTMLALSRLGRHDGTELVKQLAGNAAALSADMIDEIIERTDGVLLFLEEVTKVVLEAEVPARPFLARATQCRRPCRPRCWRGSIGSGRRRARPRRPAPRSGANSPTSWSPQSPPAAKPKHTVRSSDLSRRASSSSAGRRLPPSTSSSTRWCRTPPTVRCCEDRVRRCMRASPRRSSGGSRSALGANRRCWPTTSPRVDSPSGPPATGWRRDAAPSPVPPISRPPDNWAELWRRCARPRPRQSATVRSSTHNSRWGQRCSTIKDSLRAKRGRLTSAPANWRTGSTMTARALPRAGVYGSPPPPAMTSISAGDILQISSLSRSGPAIPN
jgi:class 3 adenylate cyclase